MTVGVSTEPRCENGPVSSAWVSRALVRRSSWIGSPIEGEDRETLSKFVPPPRVHRHRYHGVLAPNARLRPYVVAFGRSECLSQEPTTEAAAALLGSPPDSAPAPASPARIRWAVLLARIYDVLPLVCPAYRGRPEFEFDQSLPDDFNP